MGSPRMPSTRYEIDEMPEVVAEEDRIAVLFSSGRTHLWKPHRLRNFIMLATKVCNDWDVANGKNIAPLPARPKVVRCNGEES